jgi:RHS repeat-associated protein
VKSARVVDVSGQVESVVELDPWGGETDRSVNQRQQPYRYTSYERDGDGVDQALMRSYHGWWARFNEPDPWEGSYDLTDPQSLNRYTYVQNDPVNFVDPTGLMMEGGVSCYIDGVESGWIPVGARYLGGSSWGWTDYAREDAPSYTFTLSEDRLSRLVVWGGQFAIRQLGGYYSVYGERIGEEGGIEMNPAFDPVWIGAGILSGGLINSLRGGAKLGNKLDFIFGKATGSEHNIERSKSMLRQLQRIGIFDTAANRAYLKQHLNEVLKDPSNIILRQSNNRVIRESLLMGPNGGVKVVSVWEGRKLITVMIYGGR